MSIEENFEEIASSLPRVVSMLGRIAAALEDLKVGKRVAATEATPAPAIKLPPKPPETGINYDELDHSALKKLCESRHIDVPARTKSPTMVKWLKEDDQVRKVIEQTNACTTPLTEPVKPVAVPEPAPKMSKPALTPEPVKPKHELPKPKAAPEPEPEPADPFAVDEPEPPKPKLSQSDVLKALQLIQKAEGNEPVVKILWEHGGVSKLKDLDESKFEAVYNAAVNCGG